MQCLLQKLLSFPALWPPRAGVVGFRGQTRVRRGQTGVRQRSDGDQTEVRQRSDGGADAPEAPQHAVGLRFLLGFPSSGNSVFMGGGPVGDELGRGSRQPCLLKAKSER